MKKILILIAIAFSAVYANAQIHIIPSTYTTVKSHDGILVQGVSVNSDKSITVTFENGNNSNYDTTGEIVTYSFDWYFSYKGKRVSDYYTDAARCGKTVSRTAYVWPDTVPTGNEKYVSVQLGREPIKKDRRDDD